MRHNPQIFTSLQRQDEPVDPETLDDLAAELQAESRQRIKGILARVVAEAPEVQDAGVSPLTYHGWKSPIHGKKRLLIVDKEATDAPEGTKYYKTVERWRTWSKKGGRLKKPVLDEVIPGAPPHTVGFLDYHIDQRDSEGNPTGVYLDYLHVRNDQRGKGHARLLIQEIVDRHPTLEFLDFGKMMQEEIGHLKDWFENKYRGKIHVVGRKWY